MRWPRGSWLRVPPKLRCSKSPRAPSGPGIPKPAQARDTALPCQVCCGSDQLNVFLIHLCVADRCEMQLLLTFLTLCRRLIRFTIWAGDQDFDTEGAKNSLYLAEPPFTLLQVGR